MLDHVLYFWMKASEGKTKKKKKKFINWYLLTLSLPSWYVQLTLFLVIFYRTFRIKRFLAKMQKHNCPILRWIQMKLIIKSGSIPRRDIEEEPSWVYEELHMQWHAYLCCIKFTNVLPYQAENVTTIWKCARFLRKMIFLFLFMLLH